MSSLYPDILFHFTSKEGLEGILKDTFSVSYAREKIVGKGKSTEFAVPMVSFCDLRVSELKEHMGKYGSYGIGLTKEWANKQGLNPVFYVSKHSPYAGDFIKAIEDLYSQVNDTNKIDETFAAENTYMNILNTYRYIKNYEGKLTRSNGKTTRNYRFADEREWRYIPPLDSTDFPFVSVDKIPTAEEKKQFNQLVSHIKLSFQPEDIKYLIIESDDEIIDLIHHLENVKGRFDDQTRRRLASRILTAEQINSDI